MHDTGWQPASDVPGAVWREITGLGEGLDARLVVRPPGAWTVYQRGSTHGVGNPTFEEAKREAIAFALDRVRQERDRLTAALAALGHP